MADDAPHDPVRARADAAIANVDRSLATPRPTGPIHGDPEPVDAYALWVEQRAAEQAEREQLAAFKRTSERALPKGSLAHMTADQLVEIIGRAIGETRRELVLEIGELSVRMVHLEARLASAEARLSEQPQDRAARRQPAGGRGKG